MGKARTSFLRKQITWSEVRHQDALERLMSPKTYEAFAQCGDVHTLRLFFEDYFAAGGSSATLDLALRTRKHKDLFSVYFYNPAFCQLTHLTPFRECAEPYSYLDLKTDDYIEALRRMRKGYYPGDPRGIGWRIGHALFVSDFEYDVIKFIATMKELQAETKLLRPDEFKHRDELLEYENGIPIVYASSTILRHKDFQNAVYFPHIDGLPIMLEYTNGVFSRAIIGKPGSEATRLLSRVRGVPSVLSQPETLVVHGTLTLPPDYFWKMNNERMKDGKTVISSCKSLLRTALFGETNDRTTKQLELLLQVFIMPHTSNRMDTSTKELNRLVALGFQPITKWNLGKIASPNKYLMDGVEVRFNNRDELSDDIIKAPSVILKQQPRIDIMKIGSIVPQIGKGELIYTVMECEKPADKARSKGSESARRFVFNSITGVQKLGVQVGDQVVAMSSMDPPIILPYGNLAGKIGEPKSWKVCPCCSGAVREEQASSDTMLYCFSRMRCKSFTAERIERFCSPRGFGFSGLVRDLFAKLIESDMIYHVSDIFTVKSEMIRHVDPRDAELIVREISASRVVRMENFLYAITNLTYDRCLELSVSYGNIENFIGARHKTKTDAPDAEMYLTKGVVVVGIRSDIFKLHQTPTDRITKAQYGYVETEIEKHTTVAGLSDKEYDMLIQIRTRILEEHPEWEIKSSEARHMLPVRDPILKLRKTEKLDDIRKWLEEVADQGAEIVVEKKLDGISCYLEYKDGKLVSATTKKTEQFSRDIKPQVEKITGFPGVQSTVDGLTGFVRGELYITKTSLLKLNQTRRKSGMLPFRNGMGAMVAFANGKNIGELADLVRFQGYLLEQPSDKQGYAKAVAQLEALGLRRNTFDIGEFSRVFKVPENTEELLSYLSDVRARKEECKVEIDGLVLRSGQGSLIGYKFMMMTAISTIRGTRDRSITIDPVEFEDGTVVAIVPYSDATTLDAENKMTVGSKVRVSHTTGSTPTFEVIELVPGDEKPEQKRKLYLGTVYHYCAALGMSVSKKQVDLLMRSGIIEDLFDLYRLDLDALGKAGFGTTEARLLMNTIAISARRDLVMHLVAWKRIYRTSDLRWLSLLH